MIEFLLAMLLSLAAAVLVYASWRHGRRAWLAGAGWLLAFASVLPWSLALGVEIGLCYAIMVFVCLIWTAVLVNAEPARAEGAARRALQPLYRPGLREGLRQLGWFLLSVPAAGIIALLLSAGLVLPLAWSMSLKVAVVIFLFPLLWGAFSVWICAQHQLLKPTLASAGILVVAGLMVFA